VGVEITGRPASGCRPGQRRMVEADQGGGGQSRLTGGGRWVAAVAPGAVSSGKGWEGDGGKKTKWGDELFERPDQKLRKGNGWFLNLSIFVR
jgi:hypothetical protein